MSYKKKRDKFISPLKLWRYRGRRKSGASPGAPLSRTFGRELSRVAEISFVTVTIGERCAWRIVSDRRHDLMVDLRRWLYTETRARWPAVCVCTMIPSIDRSPCTARTSGARVLRNTHVRVSNDEWMMAIYRFHDIDLARPPRASRYRPVPLPRNQLIAKLADHYR